MMTKPPASPAIVSAACSCGRVGGPSPCLAHPGGFPSAALAREMLADAGYRGTEADAMLATASWESDYGRLRVFAPAALDNVNIVAMVSAS
jgi:hypothetical protein